MSTSNKTFAQELSFARELIIKAGTLALELQAEVNATLKHDGTIVTCADQAVQSLMVRAIHEAFPDDDILAEEEDPVLMSMKNSPRVDNGRRWIIDPIDGTASYVRNIPFWSTLLALEVNRKIVVGTAYLPAASLLYHAAAELGAYKNGQRLAASSCRQLSQAQLNFGELHLVSQAGLKQGFDALVGATARQRGYGDGLGPTMIFEGHAEIMIEPMGHPWDFAPWKIMAQECGAVFRDISGSDSIYGGGCFLACAGVAEEAYSMLCGGQGYSDLSAA